MPQFQGAGLTLRALTGAPTLGRAPWWSRVVVLVNVVAGGMRSITLVQAFQYWLKLSALLRPGCFVLWWSGTATGSPGTVRAARRPTGSSRCQGHTRCTSPTR